MRESSSGALFTPFRLWSKSGSTLFPTAAGVKYARGNFAAQAALFPGHERAFRLYRMKM